MIHGPLVKKGLHSPRVQTTMKEKPARVYTRATCCGIFEPLRLMAAKYSLMNRGCPDL